jgi:hypothetical protein
MSGLRAQKAQENPMEKLDEALATIVTGLEELTATHGEYAVELTAIVAQLSFAGMLVRGIILAVGAIVLALICVRVCVQRADFNDESTAPYIIGGVATGIGSLMLTVVSFKLLSSPLAWVAAFNPEIALAAKALSAAGVM